MTELQGAVGIAQLAKLKGICSTRTEYGNQLTEGIQGIEGILPHKVQEQNVCTYWFYMFRIDLVKFKCSRDEFSYALKGEGIPATAGYIPQVLYKNQLFQKSSAYRNSTFPFSLTDVDYKNMTCPNAEEILRTAIRLPISEFYSYEDIEAMISGIRKVAAYYRKDKNAHQVKKGEAYE
jgi:dTDP-4-amino-4,6-dideoxygalactose transaminase